MFAYFYFDRTIYFLWPKFRRFPQSAPETEEKKVQPRSASLHISVQSNTRRNALSRFDGRRRVARLKTIRKLRGQTSFCYFELHFNPLKFVEFWN